MSLSAARWGQRRALSALPVCPQLLHAAGYAACLALDLDVVLSNASDLGRDVHQYQRAVEAMRHV